MPRFVSKPAEIEAWRFLPVLHPSHGTDADRTLEGLRREGAEVRWQEGQAQLFVLLSGAWCALPSGTWVIREPSDPEAFYPCAPDVFEARWETPREENG